jgi:hypothetical protein
MAARNKKKNRVQFVRTDELWAVAKSLVRDYYKEQGSEANRREIRRTTTKIIVAIEDGVSRMRLAEIRANPLRSAASTENHMRQIPETEELGIPRQRQKARSSHAV